MSKKTEYIKIAKHAGIIRPDVEYDRISKSYSISIGGVKSLDGTGYTSVPVGYYDSFDTAKEQLTANIRACVKNNIETYPDILDRVTKQYHIVTQELSDRDITYQLLQSLLSSTKTSESAKISLDYIESLESQITADTTHPKGTYTSKLPEQQKKPIAWEQPDYREHPVYVFEVDCPYCGQHVTLERHSPRDPVHCGNDDCATEHNRALARERKRRQRERDKHR